MVNCPKCGTAVREEKAFCHNCGAPMDAAKAERETPLPDFGATILEPPPRRAPPPPPPQSFVPPAPREVQPTARPPAPVSPPPAGVALHTLPGTPPAARRTSARKIGIGFVLLLLFLMFLAFVLAIMVD
ncbi:MAG TPA: zinc ribbon domain-containing protein [Pyrinomonadaceae bacterium]|nr:zinc ribbon domain-containing protein [Pyrinomonadaceae bacterium]